MDEYFIVPKNKMTSVQDRAAAIQINKEPPEAVEVLSLSNLMNNILYQKNVSDWEKASQLSSTLERFLALKPKAFGESTPVVPTNVPEALPASSLETPKKPRKSRPSIPRPSLQNLTDDESSVPLPTAVRKSSRIRRRSVKGAENQNGKGKTLKQKISWIYLK